MNNDIYNFETLDHIRKYIENKNHNILRNNLFNEFDNLYNYKNIVEWNKLVRICEVLALVGWGDRESLEAYTDKWYNGSYYTYIQDQYFDIKSTKRWAKHNNSFIIYDGNDRKDYFISKLKSQRNLLPKCPIIWTKSGNYQKSVELFYKKLDELKVMLIRDLNPEIYGSDFAYLGLHLNFSHHDDKSPSVRYEYFHSENDVPKNYNGKYYIKPKFKIGKLLKQIEKYKIVIDRNYTRKFGEIKFSEQKEIFKNDLYELLDIVSSKLIKKNINYNISLLKNDVEDVINKWE